jgi:DMSO reductase anchor subunit
MWRRSWLSREVLLFTLFSGVAGLYAALLWVDVPGSMVLGGLTSAIGIGGVTASSYIYRVPSRPAWNTRLTPVQFNLTAAVLGPLLVSALGATDPRRLSLAAATIAGAHLVILALRFLRFVEAGIELQETAHLLSTVLRPHLIARGVLLVLGGVVLPLVATGAAVWWAALVVTLAAEILGRYLFFVSAVPKHMVTPYIEITGVAA